MAGRAFSGFPPEGETNRADEMDDRAHAVAPLV